MGGGQAAAQPGAPEASGPAGKEPGARTFVARDDLAPVTGALAHPSEVTVTPVPSDSTAAAPLPEPPARDTDSDDGGSGDPGPEQ